MPFKLLILERMGTIESTYTITSSKFYFPSISALMGQCNDSQNTFEYKTSVVRNGIYSLKINFELFSC